MSYFNRQLDAIRGHFSEKSSAELREIIESQDRNRWSEAAFVAAIELLRDRGDSDACDYHGDLRESERPWYQFSLRTLLGFVAVVALACGLFLPDFYQSIRRERNQREYDEAVAPFRALGGSAGPSDGEWYPDEEGKEAIDYVSFEKGWRPIVNGQPIDGSRLTDADLERLREHLESLPSLRYLVLKWTRVTDAGLVHLKGLANLEVLKLGGGFTDAGLQHLAGLPKLRHLSLMGTKVTDEGVQRLRQTLPDCTVYRGPF